MANPLGTKIFAAVMAASASLLTGPAAKPTTLGSEQGSYLMDGWEQR